MSSFYVNTYQTKSKKNEFISGNALFLLNPALSLSLAARKSVFNVDEVFRTVASSLSFKRRIKFLRPYGQQDFYMFDERRGSFPASSSASSLLLVDILASFFQTPYKDTYVYDFLSNKMPLIDINGRQGESSVFVHKPQIATSLANVYSSIERLYAQLGDITKPFNQSIFKSADAIVSLVIGDGSVSQSPLWPLANLNDQEGVPLTEAECLLGVFLSSFYRLASFFKASGATLLKTPEINLLVAKVVENKTFLDEEADPYDHLLELMEGDLETQWFDVVAKDLELTAKEVFKVDPKTQLLGLQPGLPLAFLGKVAEAMHAQYLENFKLLYKMKARKSLIADLLWSELALQSDAKKSFSVPLSHLKLFSAVTKRKKDLKELPYDPVSTESNVTSWGSLLNDLIDKLDQVIDKYYQPAQTIPAGVTSFFTEQNGRREFYRLTFTSNVEPSFCGVKFRSRADHTLVDIEHISVEPERIKLPPRIINSIIKKGSLVNSYSRSLSLRWRVPMTGSPANLVSLAEHRGWVVQTTNKWPAEPSVTYTLNQVLVHILPPGIGPDVETFYGVNGQRRSNSEPSFSFERIAQVSRADTIDLLFSWPYNEVSGLTSEQLKVLYQQRISDLVNSSQVVKGGEFVEPKQKQVVSPSLAYFTSAIMGFLNNNTLLEDKYVSISPSLLSGRKPSKESGNSTNADLVSSLPKAVDLTKISKTVNIDTSEFITPLPMFVDLPRYYNRTIPIPEGMLTSEALTRLTLYGRIQGSLKGAVEKDGIPSWEISVDSKDLKDFTVKDSTGLRKVVDGPAFVKGSRKFIIGQVLSSEQDKDTLVEDLMFNLNSVSGVSTPYAFECDFADFTNGVHPSKIVLAFVQDDFDWQQLRAVTPETVRFFNTYVSQGDDTNQVAFLQSEGFESVRGLEAVSFTDRKGSDALNDVFGRKFKTTPLQQSERQKRVVALKLHLDLYRVGNFAERSVLRLNESADVDFKRLRVFLKYDYPEIMAAHLSGKKVSIASTNARETSFALFKARSFLTSSDASGFGADQSLLSYLLYLVCSLYKEARVDLPKFHVPSNLDVAASELEHVKEYFESTYNVEQVTVAELGGSTSARLRAMLTPLDALIGYLRTVNGSVCGDANVSYLTAAIISAVSSIEMTHLNSLEIFQMPAVSDQFEGVASDLISGMETFFKQPTVIDSVSRFDLTSVLGSLFDQQLKKAITEDIQSEVSIRHLK